MKKLLLMLILLLGLGGNLEAKEVPLRNKITALYIAYFKRAPDAAGLQWWINQARMHKQNVLYEISRGFANHPVFSSTYGGMDHQEFVEAIYRNMLGQEGDELGIRYWTKRLDEGMSQADMVTEFVSGSLEAQLDTEHFPNLSPHDLHIAQLRQDLMKNRVMVALHFVDLLGQKSDVLDQDHVEEDPAYRASIRILREVDSDPYTMASSIDWLIRAAKKANPIAEINAAGQIVNTQDAIEFEGSVQDAKNRNGLVNAEVETELELPGGVGIHYYVHTDEQGHYHMKFDRDWLQSNENTIQEIYASAPGYETQEFGTNLVEYTSVLHDFLLHSQAEISASALMPDINTTELQTHPPQIKIHTVAPHATLQIKPTQADHVELQANDLIERNGDILTIDLSKKIGEEHRGEALFIDGHFAGMIKELKTEQNRQVVTLEPAKSIADAYESFTFEARNEIFPNSQQRSLLQGDLHGTYDRFNTTPLRFSLLRKPVDKARGLKEEELVLRIDIPKGYRIPLDARGIDCDITDASCSLTVETNLSKNLPLEESIEKFGLTFGTEGSYIEIGLGSYYHLHYDHNTFRKDLLTFTIAQSAYFDAQLSASVHGNLAKDWSRTINLCPPFTVVIANPYSEIISTEVAIAPQIVIGAQGSLEGEVALHSDIRRNGELRFSYDSRTGKTKFSKTVTHHPKNITESGISIDVNAQADAYIMPALTFTPKATLVELASSLTFFDVRSGIKADAHLEGEIGAGFTIVNENDLEPESLAAASASVWLRGLIQGKWDIGVYWNLFNTKETFYKSEYETLLQTPKLTIFEWAAQWLKKPTLEIKREEGHAEVNFASPELPPEHQKAVRYCYSLDGSDIPLQGLKGYPTCWKEGDPPLQIDRNVTLKVRAVLFNEDISDSLWAWGSSLSSQLTAEVGPGSGNPGGHGSSGTGGGSGSGGDQNGTGGGSGSGGEQNGCGGDEEISSWQLQYDPAYQPTLFPGHSPGGWMHGGAFAAVTRSGEVVAWGHSPDYDFAQRTEALRDQLQNVRRVYTTQYAFAALRCDGSVVSWGGDVDDGVVEGVSGVKSIYSTRYDFAALHDDGSVSTWGRHAAARSDAVQDELHDITAIYSTWYAFAALRSDGNVVTWGSDSYGGEHSAVGDQLHDVVSIVSTYDSFAALRSDGVALSWGGIESDSVADELHDVTALYANEYAFAALRRDGSVVTWGKATAGGSSDTVADQLHDVVSITAANSSFSALRSDGSVVTWGGDVQDGVVAAAQNVTKIVAHTSGFAALQQNGSVVSWGATPNVCGHWIPQPTLDHIQKLYANGRAFAALDKNGTVNTWGNSCYGGDSGAVRARLHEIQSISSNDHAFAAIRKDGSVVTWGWGEDGGDSSDVQDRLTSIRHIWPDWSREAE